MRQPGVSVALPFDGADIGHFGKRMASVGRGILLENVLNATQKLSWFVVQRLHQVVAPEELHRSLSGLGPAVCQQIQSFDERCARFAEGNPVGRGTTRDQSDPENYQYARKLASPSANGSIG